MPSSEKPYLNFVIEDDLLDRIDDFRFANRFPTRAAAVKFLLNAALMNSKTDEPPRGIAAPGVKSRVAKRKRPGKR
jgi:hypothetical protein